jgi:hypothetical protein
VNARDLREVHASWGGPVPFLAEVVASEFSKMQLMNDPNYSFAGRFATSTAAPATSPTRGGLEFLCSHKTAPSGDAQTPRHRRANGLLRLYPLPIYRSRVALGSTAFTTSQTKLVGVLKNVLKIGEVPQEHFKRSPF